MKNLIPAMFLMICFFMLGFAVSHLISLNQQEEKLFEGLRFEGNYTHPEAIKFADSYDYGDWVCVNVKGMNYPRAVEVCQHEVGHEIFAEVCEKNITKCFEVAK